ncbi:MAG: hypothetical protein HUK22_04200 [Thermoguttaceae bacterium]|nr:hypothetical protein [Thermoguttaceae bacterium]
MKKVLTIASLLASALWLGAQPASAQCWGWSCGPFGFWRVQWYSASPQYYGAYGRCATQGNTNACANGQCKVNAPESNPAAQEEEEVEVNNPEPVQPLNADEASAIDDWNPLDLLAEIDASKEEVQAPQEKARVIQEESQDVPSPCGHVILYDDATCAPESDEVTPMVARCLAAANAERARRGLRALRLRTDLTTRAQIHANNMAARGGMFHFSCSDLAGWNYATPEAAVAGWTSSPAHAAHLFNGAYGAVGFGVSWSAFGPFWSCYLYRE